MSSRTAQWYKNMVLTFLILSPVICTYSNYCYRSLFVFKALLHTPSFRVYTSGFFPSLSLGSIPLNLGLYIWSARMFPLVKERPVKHSNVKPRQAWQCFLRIVWMLKIWQQLLLNLYLCSSKTDVFYCVRARDVNCLHTIVDKQSLRNISFRLHQFCI